jgi:hypothetical protein
MNVFIKLNPGQGADLGPNFTLTANVGVLVPATATLTELLTGIMVVADNAATQVLVTSEGICTNVLTLSISTTTTTSTTTSTTSTTTTNTDCLLSGGTVDKSPYVYYPNNFVFGVLGGSGSNNICIAPTTPVYGPPCDPSDPLCIFSVPAYLFVDPYGLVPYTAYSLVRNSLGGFPSAIYNYNTTTGAVETYVSSCL